MSSSPDSTAYVMAETLDKCFPLGLSVLICIMGIMLQGC